MSEPSLQTLDITAEDARMYEPSEPEAELPAEPLASTINEPERTNTDVEAAEAALRAQLGPVREQENHREVFRAIVDRDGKLVELLNVSKNEPVHMLNKTGEKQDISSDSTESKKAMEQFEKFWNERFDTYIHEGDHTKGSIRAVTGDEIRGDGSRIIEWESRSYEAIEKEVTEADDDHISPEDLATPALLESDDVTSESLPETEPVEFIKGTTQAEYEAKSFWDLFIPHNETLITQPAKTQIEAPAETTFVGELTVPTVIVEKVTGVTSPDEIVQDNKIFFNQEQSIRAPLNNEKEISVPAPIENFSTNEQTEDITAIETSLLPTDNKIPETFSRTPQESVTPEFVELPKMEITSTAKSENFTTAVIQELDAIPAQELPKELTTAEFVNQTIATSAELFPTSRPAELANEIGTTLRQDFGRQVGELNNQTVEQTNEDPFSLNREKGRMRVLSTELPLTQPSPREGRGEIVVSHAEIAHLPLTEEPVVIEVLSIDTHYDTTTALQELPLQEFFTDTSVITEQLQPLITSNEPHVEIVLVGETTPAGEALDATVFTVETIGEEKQISYEFRAAPEPTAHLSESSVRESLATYEWIAAPVTSQEAPEITPVEIVIGASAGTSITRATRFETMPTFSEQPLESESAKPWPMSSPFVNFDDDDDNNRPPLTQTAARVERTLT